MKHLLLGASALAIGIASAGTATAQSEGAFTLDILHLNDFHSRFDPITSSGSDCAPEDDAAGECFGGIARLKTIVDERRTALEDEGGNVVLLDAGDWFQGSLYYTTYGSEIIAEFTNDLGIDVYSVGNHEFDDGPEELAALIESADYEIISGNTNVENEPALSGMLPGTYVMDFDGERVGFVSALAEDTGETSSPGDNVEFEGVFESLTAQVESLQAEDIDKIIAINHVGFALDQEIAANVAGLDLIVGGHSHTVLSNTDEDAAGGYPTMIQGPDGNEVPIVTAGSYAMYLGEISVTWDADGNVVSAEGDPILIDGTIEPDSGYVERLAELQEPIEEVMAEVVGVSAEALEGSREVCRAMECSMGNLVADAMRDFVGSDAIAIQNGGGLRASIDAGDVTMGEILTVLPFSNTLATVEISGADVVEALENGVSDIENGAGRFPQVSGLQYTYDITRPVGERVSDVMVMQDGETSPIDPEATYTVVTNNYMRGGGDGYATFAEGDNPYDFGPPLEEVVADYIAAQDGDYAPYTDGRITVAQ